MEFIVVLLCLAIQKFWPEGLRFHPNSWFMPYYSFLKEQAKKLALWKSYWAILTIVLPAQVVLLLLSIAMHGLVGHFILSLFVVWYCLGMDRFKQEAGDKPEQVFLSSYREVFAMIFWYTLIGPMGALLYYTVQLLQHTLEQDAEEKGLLFQLNQIIAVMDWVPVRLVGISYALLGHFSTIFPLWLKDLKAELLDSDELLVEWGSKAIQMSKTEDSTELQSAHVLVQRSVVVWLVALALISVGYWIG